MELQDQIIRSSHAAGDYSFSKLGEAIDAAYSPKKMGFDHSGSPNWMPERIPASELETALATASVGELRDAINRLHDNIVAWREAAITERTRADETGRRYFFWGLVLAVPIGLLGSLLAWWLGIS